MNRSALSVVPARGLCLTLVLGATTVAVLTAPPALAGSTVVTKFDLTPTSVALQGDPEVEADGRKRVRKGGTQDLNVVYTTEDEGQSLTMYYTTVDGTVHNAGTVETGDIDPNPDPLAVENGAEWWLDTDQSHCAADALALDPSFACGSLAADVNDIVRVTVVDATTPNGPELAIWSAG